MPAVQAHNTQTVLGQPVGNNYEQAPSNSDAFGAGIARGLGAVADTSNVIALQAQAFNNDTEQQAAINALNPKNQALQFDPKTGIQTKLGKDAIDTYPDYRQQAQDNYNDVRSNLSNPAVPPAAVDEPSDGKIPDPPPSSAPADRPSICCEPTAQISSAMDGGQIEREAGPYWSTHEAMCARLDSINQRLLASAKRCQEARLDNSRIQPLTGWLAASAGAWTETTYVDRTALKNKLDLSPAFCNKKNPGI